MTWISKSLTGLGLLFLAHACYSAHEHSALQSLLTSTTPHDPLLTTSSPPKMASTSTSLPLDITIETIISVIIVCMGLVMGMPELKPIVWRVWAGGIERGGEKEALERGGEVGGREFVGNPFRVLESRPGFLDVRGLRGEFAEWVKEGGGVKG